MPVKTVTFWSTLIKLAHEAGQAKLSGDEELIRKTTEAHDAYRDLCLKSDEMILPEPPVTGQKLLSRRNWV
jgi:hypothetical protein